MRLEEFLFAVTTSGAFAGMICAMIAGLVFAGLAELGRPLAANTKRLVSLAIPFGVVPGCYGVGVLLGQFPLDPESAWAVFLVAVVAATGKQLTFAGYRALRPAPER